MHSIASLAVVGAAIAFFRLDAQNFAPPPTPPVVAYVQMAVQSGDLSAASAMVAQYRRLNGDTPEALEALSWVARGELAAGHSDKAWQDAAEIQGISQATLGTRKLDAEPHLPLALGAAYELQAQILAQQHKRRQALELLETALRKWAGTSIADRLQKNINLLTLQGRPAPILDGTEWIGKRPSPPTALRGKIVLLFFWAHWCADCKAEAPVIAQLANQFGSKGLVVLAPTKRYGYTAEDEHAPAPKETNFIEQVYAKFYSAIPNAGVPIDARNFQRFGVSTTPTLVVIDRQGVVKLYHPGIMDEAALRSAIEPLLSTAVQTRATP